MSKLISNCKPVVNCFSQLRLFANTIFFTPLCFGVIFFSPFSFGSDIICSFHICTANGNVVVSNKRNLNDEYNNRHPSSSLKVVLDLGQQEITNMDIISGGTLTMGLMDIGVRKKSTINIFNEGKIIIEDPGNGYAHPLVVGLGADGWINIDGIGSEFTYKASDAINIGYRANGYLNITNGGRFISANSITNHVADFYIGGINGGNGIVNVNGYNSLLEFKNGYIGSWGKGLVNVNNGGRINAKNLFIGDKNNGEIIISGNSSVLNVSDDINIITSTDNNANGKLILNNGGEIHATSIKLGINDSPGTAEFIIGGIVHESPQSPGIIDIKDILFYGMNSIITLNHSGNQYNFNVNLKSDYNSSNNQINALNGITILSGNNESYNGTLLISSPASININNNNNLGNSVIYNNGILGINSQNNWIFNNTMYGSGIVEVNTKGNVLSFQEPDKTIYFTGTLVLGNTLFNLSNQNTTAISATKLQVNSGSIVKVGQGIQSISGLNFNGGIVNFGSVSQNAEHTDGVIYVSKNLDISGYGIIQLNETKDVNGIPQTINSSLSLMEQEDDNATIKLANAQKSNIKGNGGNLQLQDENGNTITSSQQRNIIRNDLTVAKGTYNYRLTSSKSNNGLYIGYGLTQLDLLTFNVDALELDANGKTGNSADMSARITGTGDLAFNSQKGETVSLSNQDNDYTGVTDIRSGNVLLNSNNALGQTSEIRLATDTQLDMNGHSQTVGKLNGAAGSVLNINGGNLTLTEGGVSVGILSGNGALNVSGGVLDITGASSTFIASTTIAKDAVIRINDVSGLGTANISNAGTLSLTHASGSLGNNLSGTGTISLFSSDTQLSGNNSNYSGLFVVDDNSQLTASATENLGTASVNSSGTLVLNSATGWQLTNDIGGIGNVRKIGSGSLTVGNNAAWTGQTDIDAGTLILGKADDPSMLASSQVNITENGTLSGYGGIAGNVTNSGILDLRADAPGNVLTIGGNYTGNNGTLLINTVLGDDSSATDKLVIKGDASGQTRVAVTNAGGTGAQTLNGIELIHVDGNADSAKFVQGGRIAAGAYDYMLGRGQGSNSGNWYLTSGKNTPEPTPGGYDNDLRPEAGSYTANMAVANTMFVTRLHERLGPVQYTDVMTGETKNTSMWMRHEGGHNRWRDGTGQLKTQGNRYVVQLGGDIAQWSRGETDRWHLGVMVGYGNDHNNTDSVRTGYRSKGSVNGYSAGLYATWFASDETHNGAYLDTWAQYGWFDNHVKGDGLPGESWKSKGLTASLETGYTWKAGEFSGSHGSLNEWYIQPQAQVVWMGVKADEHRESNGTSVESSGDGNIRTRLGVKNWIKGHNRMDDGKSREFRPFVEVNWLHNTRKFGTRMNGMTVHQNGVRNIGEVKAGVEGQINDRLNLWGNMGVQADNKGYSDTAAMVGVKYEF